MPYVSIIVTVYNLEKYLDKCLASVMSQSFKNFELIIVNNGSTDASQEIIDKYVSVSLPDKVKCIVQANLGISGSRNTGIVNARGKYIMYVDGDDYIGENFLEKLVVAAKHDADIVYTNGITKVDSENNILDKLMFDEPVLLFRVRGPWAHLYKRSLFDKNEIMYPLGCNYEDSFVNIAFEAFAESFAEANTQDYFYRVHSASAVHTAFKVLNDVSFPYESLTKLFQKIAINKNKNYSYTEFMLIRFFTAVIFKNGSKADIAVISRLADYASKSLNLYCKDFNMNPHLNIFKYPKVSLIERLGIYIFAKLVQFQLLKPFAILYTRF